jgi:transcriptional regulator with XRE-family HTH domain
MNAGDAIKRARIDAGLTQHALAARAGTSQATISAYESGRKQPSLETLDRVLAATGSQLAVVSRDPGRTFKDVLALAEALPVSHRPTLEYPRLPAPSR